MATVQLRELFYPLLSTLQAIPAVYLVLPLDQVDERIEQFRAQYTSTTARLAELQEEFHVLCECAHLIREQRRKLSQGSLRAFSTSNSVNETTPSEASSGSGATPDETPTRDETVVKQINNYLMLAEKSKGLDDAITAIKRECAFARSECNDLIVQAQPFLLSERFRRRLSGQPPRYASGLNTIAGQENEHVDKETEVERIVEAENTATSVGAIVGAFGAGIAYTTLFSATRGRLDLISWSFACFIVVIMNCAAIQVLAPPPHVQVANFLRKWDGPMMPSFWLDRLITYLALVLPILAGFTLLALSVALLDANSETPASGSQTAIMLAGYFPVGVLGFILFFLVTLFLDKSYHVLREIISQALSHPAS